MCCELEFKFDFVVVRFVVVRPLGVVPQLVLVGVVEDSLKAVRKREFEVVVRDVTEPVIVTENDGEGLDIRGIVHAVVDAVTFVHATSCDGALTGVAGCGDVFHVFRLVDTAKIRR